MKSILISVKPKYVADILFERKTIEIRKSMPKCDLPIDVYIYCTKEPFYIFNGKVVAKFTLNKVEEIRYANFIGILEKVFTDTLNEEELLKKSCLTREEIGEYLKISANGLLGIKEGYSGGYAWHIDNLVEFDKPKELRMFEPFNNGMPQYMFTQEGYGYRHLTKAPQSWCYVEVE